MAKESPHSRGAHTLTQESEGDYSLDERFNEESYRQSPPPPSFPPSRPNSPHEADSTEQPLPPIYRLMQNPLLFDPVLKPRNPIVLCHGMCFFFFFILASISAFLLSSLERFIWLRRERPFCFPYAAIALLGECPEDSEEENWG